MNINSIKQWFETKRKNKILCYFLIKGIEPKPELLSVKEIESKGIKIWGKSYGR